MNQGSPLGTRLEALAHATAKMLSQHLARAWTGSDDAVHGLRKALQQLRVIAKLLQPIDKAWFDRENTKLRRIRNRLAPLRDSATRSKVFTKLDALKRWNAFSATLQQLSSLEADRHRQTWSRRGVGAPFWAALERELDSAIHRVSAWPFERFDDDVLRDALRVARKRMHREFEEAEGATARGTRYELRRKLRQYAAMRQMASRIRDETDQDAEELVALAQKFGKEGDLWIAIASVRHAARERRAWGHLARALERRRLKLCARHDALLRNSQF